MAPSNSLASTSTDSILCERSSFRVCGVILRVAGASSSPFTVTPTAGRVPGRLLACASGATFQYSLPSFTWTVSTV